MGIPFAGVVITGNLITIQVPADGSDTSLFIVGGAFSPGDTAVFRSSDGTAQVLDFLTTTIDTSTLTPSNPITLQAQGFACTGIFSPALAQYIVGNGFTGGDGSIVIEGLSPFFTPADVASCLDYWVSDGTSDFDETGNIIWLGKKGTYRLQWNGEGVEPVFKTPENQVQLRDGGMILQDLSGNTVLLGKDTAPILRYRVTAFERILNSSRQAEWTGGVRGAGGRFNDSGVAYNQGNFENALSNWNGQYDSGLTEISGNSNYEGSATSIPIDTPFIFSVSGNPDNDSGRQVSQFGVGATDQDELSANVTGTAIFRAIPTASEKLSVLRFFAFTLKDRGVTYDLDSDMPDYNVRPLLAGGATSSFTGQVPSTEVQFTNIPVVGTDIYIYDDADNTELTSLTSTQASQNLPYDADGAANIRVQIIFPVGTFQELNLVFAVGTIPINVGAIADPEPNYFNP